MTQAQGIAPREPLSTVSFTGAAQANASGSFLVMLFNCSTGAYAAAGSVSYGPSDTPQSLATNLAASFQACGSGGVISAVTNGPVVNFPSCSSGTSYVETVNRNFSSTTPSPFFAEADAYLVGAVRYDTGVATLTINGSQAATYSYGSGATPTSIVSGLVSSGHNNWLVTSSADAPVRVT